MPLIKRTAQQALKDAQTAETKARELDAKAEEARNLAARLDQESLDALIENPNQAEKISNKITAQERLARAYETKADASRHDVDQCIREALELQATELDATADKLDREADKHAKKARDLKKQLEDHTGVIYNGLNLGTGPNRNRAFNARLAALLNRYYLETGTLTRDAYELRQAVPTDLDFTRGSDWPDAFVLNNKETALARAAKAGTVLDQLNDGTPLHEHTPSSDAGASVGRPVVDQLQVAR